VTLLMVGVAVAVVNRGGDSAPLEVASATMTDEGLPISTPETAGATFVCEGSDGDQQCFIELDLTALPEAGTDNLELWVINGDVTDMHSLGNVTAADGRFALPDDLTTPDSFPIVDISLEISRLSQMMVIRPTAARACSGASSSPERTERPCSGGPRLTDSPHCGLRSCHGK